MFLCEGFLQLWQAGATLHCGARASHYRGLLLRSTGSRRASSVVVAHGPSCSAACGILPDQGSNPCPLHWQADSQPLRHQGSPSPGPLFAGNIFLTNSISLLVIGLFRLSISSWFSLRRVYISRNFSMSSRLSNLYNCLFVVFPYDFLYLCDIGCYFSFSSFLFIWVLSFSWWAWLKVYKFCFSFQKISSCFHWSFLLFVFDLYFLSDLYYFLPSAVFGLCLLFFF